MYFTPAEIVASYGDCADPLNQPTGPLCYAEHDGILFLDNPVACMYAANVGLPACMRAADWMPFVGAHPDLDVMSDDYVPHPIGELFLDAARKVLA